MVDVVVLGINHKTAPIEVRERFDFSKISLEQYLPKLAERETIRSGFVLSTCNRVEIYAGGSGEAELLRDTREFVNHFHPLTAGDFDQWFYTKSNRDAVKHLFRVASSLDSLVLGEPQILGQVKEAYSQATLFSLIDPFFDRLLRKTLLVAKKVRTETKLSEQAVSISFAAVELAKKIFGSLKEKTALVLGAGEMAELVARHLHRHFPKRMMFSNRTYEAAVEFARRFEGIPLKYNQFPEYLSEADIVIVSTGSPSYVLHRKELEEAISKRRRKPIFIIDISVPRNVDPEANRLEEIYLYNIDDLAGVVEANRTSREQEAVKAEGIINEEVDRFYQTVEKLKVAPVIQILQRKYSEMTRQELFRLGKKNMLSPEQLIEVEKSTEVIVRRILNDPILFLKEEDPAQGNLERSDMVCRVFGLDKPHREES